MSRRHESLLNQYPLPQRLLIITHVFLVNGGHHADLASLHRKKKWLKNYYCIHYTHSTLWNNDEAYKTFPPLHGYCWNSIEHPEYFEQYYRRNTLEMSHFLVLVCRCLAPLRQELFIAFFPGQLHLVLASLKQNASSLLLADSHFNRRSDVLISYW